MGDLGKPVKTVEFEPLPEFAPIEEPEFAPVPAAPVEEPVGV